MKTIELYPHNQETYDKIQTLWKTENKVAAVQATGTGKSYLILKCIYNTPEVNKVVLAPSNYILEQLIKEAGEELPNTKTLTYSKLSYMSDAEIKELYIGYIFLDEFHRCGAEQWGDGVQRLLNIFPDAKVLGTSATHIRFLDNARNMGEELFNGNIVNNLSLAEAIVKKILPMPKYISALYTFDDEVNNLKTKVKNSKNDEESKKEMLKEIELMKHKLNKSKGIPNILKKHLSKNYNGKFIIFCKDKIHLDEMKETVVDWFKQSKVTKQVDVYSVYSNYEYGDAEVDAFIENKNPKSVKLLFSIEMFNEGIHIEDVTGVILLRPTVSPIIYYQQIGRAMQVGKNNTPVVFDLVNNFDNIGAKNFVEDLEKEVKLENDKLGKDDDFGDDKDKGYVDISEFMIFDETLEAMDLFCNIEDKLIDNWDARYEQLKEFYNENRHSNVPKNYKDIVLYVWVATQRRYYKEGNMNIDRMEKLNNLGFVWSSSENKWNCMYEKLKEFYNENGHTYIPINNKDRSLYNLVRVQRYYFKKGLMKIDRVEKLNNLNFIWNIEEEAWGNMYNQLREFYFKNGHSNIGRKEGALVVWGYIQRNKKDLLSKEKIALLDNVEFVWNPREKWEDMLSLLNEYKKEYGNTRIKNHESYKDKSLGVWVANQRTAFIKGKLPEEKLLKLFSVGFTFSEKEEAWNELFELLKEYKNEFDNLSITAKKNVQRKKYWSLGSKSKAML